MANNLTSNPYYVDTAATLWTDTNKSILLMQWVDDNADIAAGDELAMTINGVSVDCKTNFHDTAASIDLNNVVIWQIGPFAQGFPVKSLVVDTISHGVLYIWLQ